MSIKLTYPQNDDKNNISTVACHVSDDISILSYLIIQTSKPEIIHNIPHNITVTVTVTTPMEICNSYENMKCYRVVNCDVDYERSNHELGHTIN